MLDNLPNKALLTMGFILFVIVGLAYPAAPTHIFKHGSLDQIDLTKWSKVEGYISQGWGYTEFAAVHGGIKDNRHNGVDIVAEYGSPIYSPASGRVLEVGDTDRYCYGRNYGKFVFVEDSNGAYTLLYAHLYRTSVHEGDEVKKSSLIGYVGDTGLATGSHLHLSVFKTNTLRELDDSCGPRLGGTDIDPADYF